MATTHDRSMDALVAAALGAGAEVRAGLANVYEDKEPTRHFVVEIFGPPSMRSGRYWMELLAPAYRSLEKRAPILAAVRAALAAVADPAAPSAPTDWAPGRDWLGHPAHELGGWPALQRFEQPGAELTLIPGFSVLRLPSDTDSVYARFWASAEAAGRFSLAFVEAYKGRAWIDAERSLRATREAEVVARAAEHERRCREEPGYAERIAATQSFSFDGLFSRDVQMRVGNHG